MYAPNIEAPQYVRQMLTSMKGEINNNTIIVGGFNTPFTPMDTLSLTKGERIYNGEKTISLTSGAGKTGQPLVKE